MVWRFAWKAPWNSVKLCVSCVRCVQRALHHGHVIISLSKPCVEAVRTSWLKNAWCKRYCNSNGKHKLKHTEACPKVLPVQLILNKSWCCYSEKHGTVMTSVSNSTGWLKITIFFLGTNLDFIAIDQLPIYNDSNINYSARIWQP